MLHTGSENKSSSAASVHTMIDERDGGSRAAEPVILGDVSVRDNPFITTHSHMHAHTVSYLTPLW